MIARARELATTRFWTAWTSLRRTATRSGSAQPGTQAAGGARRRDRAAWTSALAVGHSEYRSRVAPLDEPVSVVCVSHRPGRLDAVLDAVAVQTHPVARLVLVTNSSGYDDVDVEGAVAERAAELPEVVVLRRPERVTLGACLNDALEHVDGRFAAKFDDDDLYGPEYLADSMRAHAYAGAGVVGKHTYYAYVEPLDETYLRFPAHEFCYTATLAGGTLVIDLGRTGAIRFPAVDLGEDRAFLRACLRAGVPTFSADRFGFGQTRGQDNTWSPPLDRFLSGAVPVGRGLCGSEIGL